MFADEHHAEGDDSDLVEFERAMSRAADDGTPAWVVTTSGTILFGEVQGVVSVRDDDAPGGRRVTVTINDHDLAFGEVAHWTAGLVGEPTDDQLDASITQVLDLSGPMPVEDLVVAMAQSVAPVWCTVPRALERLEVLEREQWVRRDRADGNERWHFARRRSAGGWAPD